MLRPSQYESFDQKQAREINQLSAKGLVEKLIDHQKVSEASVQRNSAAHLTYQILLLIEHGTANLKESVTKELLQISMNETNPNQSAQAAKVLEEYLDLSERAKKIGWSKQIRTEKKNDIYSPKFSFRDSSEAEQGKSINQYTSEQLAKILIESAKDKRTHLLLQLIEYGKSKLQISVDFQLQRIIKSKSPESIQAGLVRNEYVVLFDNKTKADLNEDMFKNFSFNNKGNSL